MNNKLNGKEVYEGIADLLKKFGGVSEVHECRIPDDQYEELLKTDSTSLSYSERRDLESGGLERYIDKLRREFPHISFIRESSVTK